jgi:hypothetical protein
MTANETSENLPMDAFSAKLWRNPLPANASIDVLILKSGGDLPKAPEVIETVRKKGRLGKVIEIDIIGEAGLGQILTEHFGEIESPAFILTDAESAWNRDVLDRLLKWIDKADIAIGSRMAIGRGMQFRQWLGALGRGIFWGAGVRDVHSPYRIFRTSVFQRFPLQSRGRFVDVELIAKCNFLDGLIQEEAVPVGDSWPGAIKLFHSKQDRNNLFKRPLFKFEEY